MAASESEITQLMIITVMGVLVVGPTLLLMTAVLLGRRNKQEDEP